jgi:hypothetical protein
MGRAETAHHRGLVFFAPRGEAGVEIHGRNAASEAGGGCQDGNEEVAIRCA